jgi:hypothetical protein
VLLASVVQESRSSMGVEGVDGREDVSVGDVGKVAVSCWLDAGG